ncbi:MAG: hypothetical protein JNL11_02765 [Bdellovibrionaceae bacterium]|nr:hypothetical protein [Pseudobdellovibrionaceae bacterium]
MKQSSKLITSLLFSILIVLSAISVTAQSPPRGKGAKDGGGGTFSEPLFWMIVRQEIIPRLRNSETRELLTQGYRSDCVGILNLDLIHSNS